MEGALRINNPEPQPHWREASAALPVTSWAKGLSNMNFDHQCLIVQPCAG
jgi:hypothetical protein